MTNDCGRYSEWLEAAEQGVEVITASRRLARDLKARYDERQLATGAKAWRTPTILHLDAWLSRLVDEKGAQSDVPRRLGPLASELLWEVCFLRELPADVPNPAGLARQASIAWKRLREWCVPLDVLSGRASSLDERVFAAAARSYAARLKAGRWIDQGSLRWQVLRWIEDSPGDSRPCVFAGFDRPSPAIERIMAAVETRDAVVERSPACRLGRAAFLAEFETEDAELRAAGAWARQQLEMAPDARLAIICPALESNASEIADHVRDGFVPGWQFGGTGHRAAVNVSYGRKLADLPAVCVALLILRWPCVGLTTREVSILLRSRSFARNGIPERMNLERALRQLPDRRWTPGDLLDTFSRQMAVPALGEFARVIAILADWSASAADPITPPECIQQIDTMLRRAGWPGVDAPGSDEFQLVNRWRELLNELAVTAEVMPSMTLRSAVGHLGRLAAETLWQPEAGTGKGIQVMGVLEATGMEFDGIWIAGMDATQWPPKRSPSPFIPRSIQLEYDMPDASPADTLAYSTEILERLRAAADECVISWCRNRGDGEVSASQLIDGNATVPLNTFSDPGRFAAGLAGEHTVESGPDPAPPVCHDEQVRGGAYTVQRQFKEPFSAFAFGRLGVRLLDPIPNGLSAAMRGNMIHDALHLLLAGLPDSREIGNWSHAERGRRIGSAVDTALADYRRGLDEAGLQILRLERERLRQLLFRFLEQESKRDVFAVRNVEYRTTFRHDAVSLGVRIDRIDVLPDGRLLVIDYKTGLPRHFADRQQNLSDMQLVVYAEALDEPVGGLALINIDSREISYRTAGDGWHPDESWDDTLRTWREQLRLVMNDFAAGDVRLDNRQMSSDARPLAILSRFEEQGLGN